MQALLLLPLLPFILLLARDCNQERLEPYFNVMLHPECVQVLAVLLWSLLLAPHLMQEKSQMESCILPTYE